MKYKLRQEWRVYNHAFGWVDLKLNAASSLHVEHDERASFYSILAPKLKKNTS